MNTFGLIKKNTKTYILLDEIQYIKKAGKLLKLVYDSIPNIKLIITGSSSLDLNEMGAYLVGRVLFFDLYAFSFREFLRAKNENMYNYYEHKRMDIDRPKLNKGLIYLPELNKLLHEFITYGAYPAVVLEPSLEKKAFLLKNLFQTYIEKDIVAMYGLKYKKRVIDLIRYISSLNSEMINYNDISSSLGLYVKEIKSILSILEDTFVIKLIRPYYKSLSTELKKSPKLYFMDLGLRNIMAGRFNFSQEELGKLYENYLVNSFRDREINYWRTTAKAEVDLIIDKKIPIESKITPKLTRSFMSFVKTYHPETGFIASLNLAHKQNINSTQVFFYPFALF